jgi:hypothetical protein
MFLFKALLSSKFADKQTDTTQFSKEMYWNLAHNVGMHLGKVAVSLALHGIGRQIAKRSSSVTHRELLTPRLTPEQQNRTSILKPVRNHPNVWRPY